MGLHIEVMKDNTFSKRTGRIRFRTDRKGRMILQVEHQVLDRFGDKYFDFRDAKLSDVSYISKED